ncbi:hypothetical protein ACFX12_035928 [Malus domestica]
MPSSTSSSSSSSKSLRRRVRCSSLFFFYHILNKKTQKPMIAATPCNTITALSAADPLEALSPFLGVEGSSAEPKLNRRLMDKRRRIGICSCRHRWQWLLRSPFMLSVVFLAEPK